MTLIDLVITVLILSIVAAAAAPRFADAIHRSRGNSAAGRIKSDLEWARQHALSTSSSQTIQFDAIAHNYRILSFKHLNNSGAPYVVELDDSPYDAELVSAEFGSVGETEVTFDLYGQPDNTGTIIVRSGGYQRTIIIEAETGKVTIP